MQPSFPRVDLSRTVCAIATPPGRGGLGIVRLSGPNAIQIADRVFRGRKHLLKQPGFTVHHGFFIDPQTNQEVDEVLATLFRTPNSFTKEDLVEFSAHGGRIILQQMVDVLIENGAAAAIAGEFTLRAFLNGRIDLTEAEAIADLVAAKTEESAAAALRQLKGDLLKEVQGLRQEVMSALASLEVGIDFVEEDIDAGERMAVARRLADLDRRIERMLAGHRRGRILRDGFTVVLAGPPNVGKSTLFNRLARDERAIVTDIPGTTRDVLREYVNLDGWPVCVVDTAGLRDSTDLIERIGIERTSEAVGHADGIIWMLDPLENWKDELSRERIIQTAIPCVLCFNKVDLVADPEPIVQKAIKLVEGIRGLEPGLPVVGISAKTGQGTDSLLEHIGSWVSDCGMASGGATAIAINDRHYAALRSALESIRSASRALSSGSELELVAFDAKSAAAALGEIIGETTTEEILGEIFSNFCIGK